MILEKKEKGSTQNLTLRIPSELGARLARASEETGLSQSKIVVRLVELGLDQHEKEKAQAKKARR